MFKRAVGSILVALAAAAGSAAARDVVTSIPTGAQNGEPRYALVIGNAAYTHGPLRNPINDARGMARELSESGFEVLLVEDATQAGMQRAIRRFGDQIAKGGIGLFYYAGHGMQSKGRNYLVPVNADIAREYEIEFNSVDVNLVLAMMDAAKNALNIVVLDACRTNPFARSFRVAATGLAHMDAPSGTFIAFATAPGAVASDGTGSNGIYTKHLLEQIRRPGVTIEALFKQVRIGVMAETKGEQTPWESSSLRGDFAFRAGTDPSVALAISDAIRRDRELQKQHTEALLQADREQQKQRTEALIQAALERQRQEFQGLLLSAAAKPAVNPTPAAVLEPSRPAQREPGFPKAGDSWTYRLTDHRASKRSKPQNYVVTVAAASTLGVLDRTAIDGGGGVEFAHGRGPYLFAQGLSLFSPYLAQFQALRPGLALGSPEILDQLACKPPYGCVAKVKSITRESISVPAGNFVATKVAIEHSWFPTQMGQQSNSMAADMWGARTLTVWYAPETRRAIKFSSRLEHGRAPAVDGNFDLELVSYQLK